MRYTLGLPFVESGLFDFDFKFGFCSVCTLKSSIASAETPQTTHAVHNTHNQFLACPIDNRKILIQSMTIERLMITRAHAARIICTTSLTKPLLRRYLLFSGAIDLIIVRTFLLRVRYSRVPAHAG